MKLYCLLFALLIFSSCQHSYDGKVLKLLKSWEGREIIFRKMKVLGLFYWIRITECLLSVTLFIIPK